MPADFDRLIDRRHTNAIKYDAYPDDVLPMWVADMDFPAPKPILDALQRKIDHGIFGYEMASQKLLETVAARMQKLYDWQVEPEMVVAVPGIVSAFYAAAMTVCKPKEGVLIQPPVYPPFLRVPDDTGLILQNAPLQAVKNGSTLHYEVDLDIFTSAFNQGNTRTGMFLLCNPHNPTGDNYSPKVLTRMAEVCLQNKTVICSDEIHSELLLGGTKFTPIASLASEIGNQTITLVAPSKTFNIAGLFCGFAIIPNEEIRKAYKQQVARLTLHVSSLGFASAQAAFSGECDDWLTDLNAYLTKNRDILVDYVKQELPGIRTTVPHATYLAWMDCSDLVRDGQFSTTAHKFFLKKARVALNEGADFGFGGDNFVRFNFGCPQERMLEALDRMKTALQ